MKNGTFSSFLNAKTSKYGVGLVTGDHTAMIIADETVIVYSKTVRSQGKPNIKIWDYVIDNNEPFTGSPDSNPGYKTLELAAAAAENFLN